MENKVNHVAIIMDGNRRYAKKKLLSRLLGHDKGDEVVDQLFDWCKELNLKQLTLYTLSTENLKRDQKELDKLFILLTLL